MGTKYKPDDHKRAFGLYRELGSYYAVSKEPGMPSRDTLMRWSRPNFACKCGFHGWEDLEKRIRREVRKRWEQECKAADRTDRTDERIKSDLEKYIRPDLKKLQIN